MRVFKNRWFERFTRKERIADEALCEAVMRAGKGLIDADLGNGVIKQRIARPGAGRSSGYRSLLYFRAGDRAVFVFGFAKNAKANLSEAEVNVLKKSAGTVLSLAERWLDVEVSNGRLVEVICRDDEV